MDMFLQVKKLRNISALLLSLLFSFSSIAKTVQDVIPITTKNMKGHKALYQEGWLVVTSSQKALDYAYENSVKSSAETWQKLKTDISTQNQNYSKNFKDISAEAKADGKLVKNLLAQNTKEFNSDIKDVAKSLNESSVEQRKKAFETLVVGYMELQERTQDDVDELKRINKGIFGQLKNDFSNYSEVFENLETQNQSESRGFWEKSFLNASEEFQKEYVESSQQTNSLLGLWSLGKGYLKATYMGLVRPSGQSALGLTLTSYKLVERTVISIGQNFYYSTRIGYKVISPTIESGLLGSLSLITWSSSQVASGVGAGINAINQIAVVSSEPVYRSGHYMLASSAHTAKHAVVVSREIGLKTGQIAFNQIKAGLVLGYNALTAIPTQALLGAANSVIFLAYDGPRLAIYAARGEIDGVPLNQLPVGTVVDMEKLKDKNIEVEQLSDDFDMLDAILKNPRQGPRDEVP